MNLKGKVRSNVIWENITCLFMGLIVVFRATLSFIQATSPYVGKYEQTRLGHLYLVWFNDPPNEYSILDFY